MPDKLIPASQFCEQHNIEVSFISLLHENGLLEMTTIEKKEFIPADRLQELEKFVRLHYEMDINLEGIDAITHLLEKIQSMQDEITMLKNRLRFYERD